MVKTAFSAFAKLKIEGIPGYYLSQYSKYSFLHDDVLQSFFEHNIPAVKINLSKSSFPDSSTNTYKFISQLIENCKNEETKSSDYHSLMLHFFRHTLWLTEYSIIRIVILTFFLSLIFIFTLGLLNSNLKNEAWKQIKNNWYTLPLTFLLSSLGFLLGKVIYIFFYNKSSGSGTVYGILILQILLSSMFVSIFFLLELFYHKSYGEHSVDFLMLISSFASQYLFCLFDLSLFPFFMIECIIAILAIILKRNWQHIVLLVFIILFFAPYIFGLYNLADLYTLRQFLITGKMQCLIIPLMLLPIYLMLFRIFTATKKRFSQKKVFLIIVSSTYFFFFMLLFILNAIFFSEKPEPAQQVKIIAIDEPADNMDISISDKKVFSDIVRTISLKFSKQPEAVVLLAESDEKNPILYSENDFAEIQPGKDYFLIPPNPPKEMTFVYGTEQKSSKITVELIYVAEDNVYYSCTKEMVLE